MREIDRCDWNEFIRGAEAKWLRLSAGDAAASQARAPSGPGLELEGRLPTTPASGVRPGDSPTRNRAAPRARTPAFDQPPPLRLPSAQRGELFVLVDWFGLCNPRPVPRAQTIATIINTYLI